jgi:thiol-disulfide isomerase/thioredoxin
MKSVQPLSAMKLALSALILLPTISFCALAPLDEAGFQKLVDSHKGKVVLYQFWATWCVPCRAEMPQLVRLEGRLRSQGFKLVTISADEPDRDAAAEKIVKQLAVPGPSYRKQTKDDDRFNGSIDKKWAGELPALFLFDKSGRKVRSFIGETDIGIIEAAIRKLL